MAFAENALGAHQSPDLFHVQQELSRAVSGPMAAKVHAAEQAEEKSKDSFTKARIAAVEYLMSIDSRGPGRPPDLDARVDHLAAEIRRATAEKERLEVVRVGMRDEVKGLGNDYHMADLTTGDRLGSNVVLAKLQRRIDTIRAAATAEGLGEKSMDRIAKAERVLPQLAATIDFVSCYVRQQVDKLGLSGQEPMLSMQR